MNRVVLVGRLTRDPELRTSGGGNAFVGFTIAVNRTFQSANGEREADFINCIAFNKQAENLNRYIRKGGLVGVEGRIQTRNFTGQDGVRRFVTEVVCDNIQFLEPKQSTGASNTSYYEYSPYDMPQQPRQPQQPKKEPFNDIQNQFGITDDDLPF
ncbi:MAG: single-stranded DNA-binding protein [Bacilli bacterium]|nr:single-stranded DNA-binding protein [Bacilli bacterium]